MQTNQPIPRRVPLGGEYLQGILHSSNHLEPSVLQACAFGGSRTFFGLYIGLPRELNATATKSPNFLCGNRIFFITTTKTTSSSDTLSL